jgi:hypothetical protein
MSLLNAHMGTTSPTVHVALDALNLLNADASDVDDFCMSRPSGEPLQAVPDIHTHPTLPRSVRLSFRPQF